MQYFEVQVSLSVIGYLILILNEVTTILTDLQNLSKKSYKIVELKVYSNHGNTDYTCIYRIRVHGILTSYENTNY